MSKLELTNVGVVMLLSGSSCSEEVVLEDEVEEVVMSSSA